MSSPAPSSLPQAERPRPRHLSELFWSLTFLALQGFGGVLAVVQRELVEKRQWLSNEVIPSLRDAKSEPVENLPSLSSLNWAGISVPLLHYQHHAWIKWRDMPELMQVQRPFPITGTCR